MNSVLLRAAYEQGIRHFVFFSCSIMYAPSPRPVRESDFQPGGPLLSAYFGAAWTKVYVEQMCEFYSQLGRSKFTVIRHSNIFGPHDKYDLERSHVFAATVTKVLEGEGPIVVWGDGREARDFLYVDDLVACVDRALERQQTPYELVNAGSGSMVTVAELVRKVQTAAGVSREVRYQESAPTLKTSLCLDATKAGTLFAWEPRTSLDEGIRRTLAWRRAELARPSLRGEACSSAGHRF
jgi:nucleoside-diphosphate-sugar epimerase